jgi:hypothetical protein
MEEAAVKPVRLAFAGASGTGKSTLATYTADLLGLPQNPVGSRSVAAAMGFASPYDVDRAGKRAEFQQRLLAEKTAWERHHDAFVTDRTTLDVLAYFALHSVRSIDSAVVDLASGGAQRYTHVVYCPARVFLHTGDDPARVSELSYHHLYDDFLDGLLRRHLIPWSQSIVTLNQRSLDDRKQWLRHSIGWVDS